jgi:hypothetical protein
MFPSKKTYLKGHSFQCKRILRGRSIEDEEEIYHQLRQKYHTVTETDCDFIADGLIVAKPTKHRESWDVVDFTQSSYFTFNGERIYIKHIRYYDPAAGTFQTGDGFFTLYPLPTA